MSNDVGRPSKFTPERCEAIVDSVANYVPYEIAAEANGIGHETLWGWIRDGRKDIDAGLDTEKARFSERLKKVEENKIKLHANKIACGVDKWQSDAWLLERKWWKHFGANAPLIEMNARLDKMEAEAKEKQNG